jgi:hypothetical protein
MKKYITLRTDKGDRVFLTLDGWGAGVDKLHRRWTRDPDGWRCLDNGDIAHKTGLLFSRPMRTLGLARR